MPQSLVTGGDAITKFSARVLLMKTRFQKQLSVWGGEKILHQEQECGHDATEQKTQPRHQPLPAETPHSQGSRWNASQTRCQWRDALLPSHRFETAKAEGFFFSPPCLFKEIYIPGHFLYLSCPEKGYSSHWVSEAARSQQGLENQHLSLKSSRVPRPFNQTPVGRPYQPSFTALEDVDVFPK